MKSRRVDLLILTGMLLVIDTQICCGRQFTVNIMSDIVESVKTVTKDEIKTVQLNYTLSDPIPEGNINLALCVSVEDRDVAVVISRHSSQANLKEQPSGQFDFSVKGLFVGRTKLYVRFIFSKRFAQFPCKIQTEDAQYDIKSQFNLTNVLSSDEWTPVSFQGHREIVVIRQHRAIDTAFNIGVVLLVLVVNLGVGCKSDLLVVKNVLRRPIAPLTGFCSQFIIMPLISYGAVKIFQFEPALALGFFALGCSPGGSASNAYTMLLDGDVSLSITMTFISTVAALGMVPLWLLTLGRTLYSDTNIKIPYQNIFYSLLGLLVPVCIGLFIQRKRPRWAAILIKISKVVMIIFLIFVLTVGVYTNLYIFQLVTLPVIAASATLPYLGFFLGGLVAFICRMSRVHVLTVAIETGIQNTGIAIVLLLLSLSHPESDISIVAPIISAIFTPLPLWVGIAFVQGRKRCCQKKQSDHEDGSDKEATEALKDEERDKRRKDEENWFDPQTTDNGVGLIDGSVGATAL